MSSGERNRGVVGEKDRSGGERNRGVVVRGGVRKIGERVEER